MTDEHEIARVMTAKGYSLISDADGTYWSRATPEDRNRIAALEENIRENDALIDSLRDALIDRLREQHAEIETQEPLRALCAACHGSRCSLCRNTGYELDSAGQRVRKVGVIVADHPVHGWHMDPCVNWEDIGEGTFLYAAEKSYQGSGK